MLLPLTPANTFRFVNQSAINPQKLVEVRAISSPSETGSSSATFFPFTLTIRPWLSQDSRPNSSITNLTEQFGGIQQSVLFHLTPRQEGRMRVPWPAVFALEAVSYQPVAFCLTQWQSHSLSRAVENIRNGR